VLDATKERRKDHFALETHHQEIAAAIRDFLDRELTVRFSAA
jgi:hypothetical protein